MATKKKGMSIRNNSVQTDNKKQGSSRKIPVYALVFVLLWVFCSFVYGDVFYITGQFSFFAFDSVLMKEVTDMSCAPMMIAGRMLLVLFKYPLLGGFVYALILTFSAFLVGYVFRLRGYWQIISLCIPFIWLFVLEYLGLNIFYQYEPSFVCSYPFLLMILLAVVAGVIKWRRNRSFKEIWLSCPGKKTWTGWVNAAVCVLLFAGITALAQTKGQNTVYTAKMQRMLQSQDWEGMVELGCKAKQPSRPVACYYAIALVMSDQLNEKLFDMFYQYPDIKLVNRTGGADVGNFMYEADADFYCGLVNPSYHNSMEHVVASGKTTYRLKQLFLCALLNKEIPLAEKYMAIIEKIPFEGAFVKQYKPMLYDYNLVMADPVLSAVIDMMPMKEILEEQFVNPLFIGYYKSVSRSRSLRVFKNCLAASLYTKDVNDFLRLMTEYRLEGSLPQAFYDMFVIYAIKSKNQEFLANAPIYCVRNIQQMLSDARQLGKIGAKEKAKKLRDKYLGTYAFYYYYQNAPDENYNTPKEEKTDGGKKQYNKVN